MKFQWWCTAGSQRMHVLLYIWTATAGDRCFVWHRVSYKCALVLMLAFVVWWVWNSCYSDRNNILRPLTNNKRFIQPGLIFEYFLYFIRSSLHIKNVKNRSMSRLPSKMSCSSANCQTDGKKLWQAINNTLFTYKFVCILYTYISNKNARYVFEVVMKKKESSCF